MRALSATFADHAAPCIQARTVELTEREHGLKLGLADRTGEVRSTVRTETNEPSRGSPVAERSRFDFFEPLTTHTSLPTLWSAAGSVDGDTRIRFRIGIRFDYVDVADSQKSLVAKNPLRARARNPTERGAAASGLIATPRLPSSAPHPSDGLLVPPRHPIRQSRHQLLCP